MIRLFLATITGLLIGAVAVAQTPQQPSKCAQLASFLAIDAAQFRERADDLATELAAAQAELAKLKQPTEAK